MTTNNNQILDDQLLDACHQGNLNQVKDLVNQGASPFYGGESSLLWACVNGHLNIVKYLIEECHCKSHLVNDLLLTWTVSEGSFDVAIYLLLNGADIEVLENHTLNKLIVHGLSHPLNDEHYQWARNNMNAIEGNGNEK